MDLAHPAGSIFGTLNPEHALSTLCGIVLMSPGLAGSMTLLYVQRVHG